MSNQSNFSINIARVLFTVALFFALLITFFFIDQPLLDMHSFRQTQTAVSVFWMLQEGFNLNYQTPVVGFPWQIPFEFPVFQAIVAGVVQITSLDLDMAGRAVSYFFLLASMVPVYVSFRKLELDSEKFWYFGCLFLTSPLYLYWGRAFLIETTALFFILCTLPFYIDIFRREHKRTGLLLFAVFALLALLQKITTALPVLMILALLLAIRDWREQRSLLSVFNVQTLYTGLVGFLVPVLIAYLWTNFTDQVKSLNPIGMFLTSAELSDWNWGTWEQKTDPALYKQVLWDRLPGGWFFGVVSIVLFAYTFYQGNRVRRFLISVVLAMFMLPVLLFTNLHHEHTYYQVSMVIFWLMAVAIAIDFPLLSTKWRTALQLAVVVFLVVQNLQQFQRNYLPVLSMQFKSDNNLVLALSEEVKQRVPKEQAIIALGFGWNSALAYYSQRKAVMVPEFVKVEGAIWQEPQLFLGDVKLGAIINCKPQSEPMLQEFLARNEYETIKRLRLAHCDMIFFPDSKVKSTPDT